MRDVQHVFRRGGKEVHACSGVSLSVDAGETVAVIGESGSGKTTLGRIALGLLTPTSGMIRFDGKDLAGLGRSDFRALRSKLQVVFQEPYESLNPRMKVADIVAEPLIIHDPDLSRGARREKVLETLERVGLTKEQSERYPRGLSGGQQQRVGVARAIVTEPRLIVLDEPTSSLDVSVRAHVLELLRELQRQQHLGYVFISHDLATVASISDRVAVMYLGQIVEQGPTSVVLSRPRHPYTRALLSAALSTEVGDKRLHVPLHGEIPNPSQAPRTCVLVGRCPIQIEECTHGLVPLHSVSADHEVACIRAEDSPELLQVAAQAES